MDQPDVFLGKSPWRFLLLTFAGAFPVTIIKEVKMQRRVLH
jgi:hypothetical protein